MGSSSRFRARGPSNWSSVASNRSALDPVVGSVPDEDLAAGQKGSPHPRRVEVLPMPRLRRVDCSGRDPPGPPRARLSYEEADGTHRRSRGDRADPRARDPARLEGRLDLPGPRTATCRRPGSTPPGASSTSTTRRGATSRDREKFDEMLRFARALPAMRERTAADLRARGLVRDRVLACAVRLLDLGFFRVGSRAATRTRTRRFGLSTLRRRHVHVDGEALPCFDYKAKGSKRPGAGDRGSGPWSRCSGRWLAANRRRLPAARLPRGAGLGGRHRRRDQRLPEGGHRAATTRAKDFRTWNATVLAAVGLAENARGRPPRPRASGSSTTASRRRGPVPLQHARGLPPGLHRPAGVRPLRLRRDDSHLA